MQEESEIRILGIDPGTNILGYSIIECIGKNISILTMDVLVLGQKEEMNTKMKKLFDKIVDITDIYKPDILAIEAPFFGKNVQSMLKLGRAQGLCIAAAFSRSVPFVEYSPRKIKQSITGNGAASKEQVANMLKRILDFDEIPQYLDATDSLAVAVCHFYQQSSPCPKTTEETKKQRKTKSWSSFISRNPNRVRQ